MRVVTLVGNRPQFIKEAVVHQELQKTDIDEIIVNSGQHYDALMSDVFFQFLKIKAPDFNLNVGSGTHAQVTGKTMIEFEKVVTQVKPDMIVVYGDTNTTLAGAIVAAKEKIPLAHVEAGIRMTPKSMPEEINRTLTDRVAELLFTPCESASAALKRENASGEILCVGDVMYDLFLRMQPSFSDQAFKELKLKQDGFALVTLHRDFNVDSPESLTYYLTALAEINKSLPVVLPIHPRTKSRIEQFGLGSLASQITITEPVEYLTLMGLVQRCKCVITDSGGLQKEAYYAGKRAYVLMDDPGWRELVEVGWNMASREITLEKLERLFTGKPFVPNIYGAGDAAVRIVKRLERW